MIRDGAAVGEFGDAGMLLDGDAGEIGDLLAQAGEAVEKRGLAGVGRADDSAPLLEHAGARGIPTTVAAPQPWQSPHSLMTSSKPGGVLSSRTLRRRAVSRRSAISEPSTWKTRGSPPGALMPGRDSRRRAESRVPSDGGRRRPAGRCGRGWPHRRGAGRPGSQRRFPVGRCCHSVASCSVCRSPK